MQKIEREVTRNKNGSSTIKSRLVETTPTTIPYGGTIEIVLAERQIVRWPKAKDIISNVPSRRRRRELMQRVGLI